MTEHKEQNTNYSKQKNSTYSTKNKFSETVECSKNKIVKTRKKNKPNSNNQQTREKPQIKVNNKQTFKQNNVVDKNITIAITNNKLECQIRRT